MSEAHNYDADELLARARADQESDWPTRLLEDISNVPLIAEENIVKHMRSGSATVLTENQKLTLMYYSRGLNRNEIADITGMSLEAVKGRLAECRAKLAGKHTAHAACNAIREGIIP